MLKIHFLDKNAPKGTPAACGANGGEIVRTHILHRVTCIACREALEKKNV